MDKVVAIAEAVGVVAEVSCSVHEPWYSCILDGIRPQRYCFTDFFPMRTGVPLSNRCVLSFVDVRLHSLTMLTFVAPLSNFTALLSKSKVMQSVRNGEMPMCR